jgi:hypothetical protein
MSHSAIAARRRSARVVRGGAFEAALDSPSCIRHSVSLVSALPGC